MKKTISLVLSLVMLLSIATFGTQAFAADYVADSDARAMLTSINDFRTGSDAWYWNETDTAKVLNTALKGYTYDENLEKIAKIRAEEISRSFSHTRPGSTTPDDYYTCTATDANGKVVESWGENIAYGTNMDANGAYVAWREDEYKYAGQGHRRNMLSEKFTTIGIAGYVADNGNVYWVQEFGYELSAQSGDSAPGSQTVAKPKATKITKLTAKKKGFVVQWKKGASGVKGYQIQYSLKSNFKNSKTVTVKGVKTTKKAVSKLKAKKKYYVRVRTYKVVNGKKVTSNWSAKKAIKTKG